MLVETPGAIPWSESFPYQITFTSIAFGFAVWKFGILFSTNYIDVGCNIALVCSKKRWDWRTLSAERDYHGARPANKPPRSKRWWWLFSYWHCIEKPGELIAQLRFQPAHNGRRNPQYSGGPHSTPPISVQGMPSLSKGPANLGRRHLFLISTSTGHRPAVFHYRYSCHTVLCECNSPAKKLRRWRWLRVGGWGQG
jgi:hypothetical protein